MTTRLPELEAIFDEQQAIYISEFSSAALASTLTRLASDPAYVERTASAGRVACLSKFSQQAVGRDMKRLLGVS